MQHFFLKYIKITAAFAVLLLLLLPLLLQHFFPEVYKNYVCLRSYVVVVVVVAVAVVSHFFPEVHEDYVCLRSYVVVVVVVVVVVADVVCAAAAAAAAATVAANFPVFELNELEPRSESWLTSRCTRIRGTSPSLGVISRGICSSGEGNPLSTEY